MTVNFDLRGFKTHLRSNLNKLQAPGLHIIQYYIIYKTVTIVIIKNYKSPLQRGPCTPRGKTNHKESIELSQNH